MLTPAGIFDTDSIEAMRIGAVKGLGIASIPRILIEEDLHSGRLVEIVPHAPLAPVALHMSHCFRSEEHTSELQSLMRNSYAVFCLKKKNKKINTNTRDTHTDNSLL